MFKKDWHPKSWSVLNIILVGAFLSGIILYLFPHLMVEKQKGRKKLEDITFQERIISDWISSSSEIFLDSCSKRHPSFSVHWISKDELVEGKNNTIYWHYSQVMGHFQARCTFFPFLFAFSGPGLSLFRGSVMFDKSVRQVWWASEFVMGSRTPREICRSSSHGRDNQAGHSWKRSRTERSVDNYNSSDKMQRAHWSCEGII